MALPVLEDKADVVYQSPQRRMKTTFERAGAVVGAVMDDLVGSINGRGDLLLEDDGQ